MRQCGECTLCCKLGAVSELKKKQGVWCSHISKTGCSLYPNWPKTCSMFRCLWLEDALPDFLSPLNTKCVVMLHVSKVPSVPTEIVILEDYKGRVELFTPATYVWKKNGFVVTIATMKY